MLACVFIGFLTLAGPAAAILCDSDLELENVQEYTYDIGHDAGDLDYWRTYHNNFIVFGEFNGGDPTVDATIEAGYYTAEGDLVYKIAIDCSANTWKALVTSNAEETVFLEGELETACAEGDVFDLFLKVQQPHLMNWVFDGQALQFDTNTTYFNGKERSRGFRVTTEHAADTASQFRIKTTGSAVLTRFAFGKCFIWPEEISANCTNVAAWLLPRSKSTETGLGPFGTNNNAITVDCAPTKPEYFNWLQTKLHPDKDSKHGASYCCCVDMQTGELYENDKEKWCMEDYLNACTLQCFETYDGSLMY